MHVRARTVLCGAAAGVAPARLIPCHAHRCSRRRGPSLLPPVLLQSCSRPDVKARAEKESDKPIEALFLEELKRRGLDSMDGGDSTSDRESTGRSTTTTSTSKSPFQSATKTSPRTKPSEAGTEGQRERSIAMVNEGLEGLIPRASELLKLGGSIFLAFVPFIVAISLLFGGIYMVFGDQFVHGGGKTHGQPTYVDPEKLLSEPTVDPYVPYQ